jgi:very-short-patch-repair endonuclease
MQIIHNSKVMNNHRRKLRRTQTKEEDLLWQRLRNRRLNNLKFTRQHSILGYIADFYCAEKRLVVELDGSHHYSQVGVEYDKVRSKIFEAVNVKVLRFKNEEIKNDIKSVLERILEVAISLS